MASSSSWSVARTPQLHSASSGPAVGQRVARGEVDVLKAGAHDIAPTPITLYKFDAADVPVIDRLIAVSSRFICYAVKARTADGMAGIIRVLSRETGARTLLRGHTAILLDLQFFGPPEDGTLLSTSQDGTILFWKISEGGDKLDGQLTKKISHTDENAHYVCVRCQAQCVLTVDSTGNVTVFPTSDGGGDSGGWCLQAEAEQPFAKACMSADGERVAAVDSDGGAALWTAAGGRWAEAQLVKRWQVGAGSVFGVDFVGQTIVTASAATENAQSRLKVWSAQSCELLQELGLMQKPFDRLSVNASASLALLASSSGPELCTFHIGSGEDGSVDYACHFSVGTPVVSLSSLVEEDVLSVFCVQLKSIQQFTVELGAAQPAGNAPSASPEAALADAPPAVAPAEVAPAVAAPAAVAPAVTVAAPVQVAEAAAASPPVGAPKPGQLPTPKLFARSAPAPSASKAAPQQAPPPQLPPHTSPPKPAAPVSASAIGGAANPGADLKAVMDLLASQHESTMAQMAQLVPAAVQSALPSLCAAMQATVVSEFKTLGPALEKAARCGASRGSCGGSDALAASVRASMHTVVVPALDGMLQRAFGQVNETLERGLQERLAAAPAAASAAPKPAEAPAPDKTAVAKAEVGTMIASGDFVGAISRALNARCGRPRRVQYCIDSCC